MAKVTTFPDPEITTNARLADHLRRSLADRGCAIGSQPTWGSVKAAVEAAGVTDDTPFSSIEIGCAQTGSGVITVERDEFGAVDIKENYR